MTYDNFDRSLFQALISFDSCAKFVLGGGGGNSGRGHAGDTLITTQDSRRHHVYTITSPSNVTTMLGGAAVHDQQWRRMSHDDPAAHARQLLCARVHAVTHATCVCFRVSAQLLLSRLIEARVARSGPSHTERKSRTRRRVQP